MEIAMAAEGFFAPFQGWVQSLHQLLAPRRARRGAHAAAPQHPVATKTIAAQAIPVRPAGQFGLKKAPALPVRRPLRVVRVFEGPQAPAVAGRMVISGRMADVCAELDRLAAQEKRAG